MARLQWSRTLVNSPPTEEEARREVEKFAEDIGIVRSNVSPGSREDAAFAITGKCWYEYAQGCRYNATRYFIDSAQDEEDINALGLSFYGTARRPAVTARGRVTLQLSDYTLSYDKEPGDILISDGTYILRNAERVVLDGQHPFAVATFEGEHPGTAYNLGNNVDLEIISNMSAVKAKNPPVEGTTTWLTTVGRDQEQTEAYKNRLKQQWYLLRRSGGTSADNTKADIIDNVPGIKYVAIDPNNPRGFGKVDIYVSGDVQTADVYDVANAQALVSGKEFGTADRFLVMPAREVNVVLEGKVIYDTSYDLDTLKKLLDEQLRLFVSKVPIGGDGPTEELAHTVFKNDIEFLAEDIAGVHTIRLSLPTDDIVLGLYDKLTIELNSTSGLEWVPRTRR